MSLRARSESPTTPTLVDGAATVSDQTRLITRDLFYNHDTDLGVINLDLPFGTRPIPLAGILPPRGGEVNVDGHSPTQVVGNEVLFSTENAHVFATTVRDNFALSTADATDEDMREVLEAVGLSGGQRRCLLLARVLLTDAPILLLDEPIEHLDATSAAEMLEMLNRDELPGRRVRRTVVVARRPR